MRIRYVPAAVTITLMVLLTSCSSSDTTSSLEVPDMPNTSTSNEMVENEAPNTVPTNPDATPTPGEEAPYVNPLTGETSTGSTEQGVQDFSSAEGATPIAPNEAAASLLESSGLNGNKQAQTAVAGFSSTEVQSAYDTVLGFVVSGARTAAITSPGPNGFTSDEALRSAMTASLQVWMSPPAMESVINQSIALTKVPVTNRTPAQQSFYALFPVALCQKANESCLMSDGTAFSKPVISPWTSGSGLAGLQFTNEQYYTSIVQTYSGDRDTGLQRLNITFTLTAQVLPDTFGKWTVVGVKADNVAFQVLEQIGPVS